MKRRVGTLYKIPVVEGDPNEVDENEILIQKDNSTGEISNLQKRTSKGYEDVIKLPANVMEVTAFNAEEFELYLMSDIGASSATVTAVRQLTQFKDYLVQLDATDLVSGSAGGYSLKFYFVIDKKGTYNVGDKVDKFSYVVIHNDNDDQPSIQISNGNDNKIISYQGEVDEEENYHFHIMIVTFSDISPQSACYYSPITYYGNLRVYVDTSKLG